MAQLEWGGDARLPAMTAMLIPGLNAAQKRILARMEVPRESYDELTM